jgi:hypothetical protein
VFDRAWFPNFILILDHLKVVEDLSEQLSDFSASCFNSCNAVLQMLNIRSQSI